MATTAEEMQLIAVAEGIIDDEEDRTIAEDAIGAMVEWQRIIMERARRGELPDHERRELLAWLDETLPQVELLIERNKPSD